MYRVYMLRMYADMYVHAVAQTVSGRRYTTPYDLPIVASTFRKLGKIFSFATISIVSRHFSGGTQQRRIGCSEDRKMLYRLAGCYITFEIEVIKLPRSTMRRGRKGETSE